MTTNKHLYTCCVIFFITLFLLPALVNAGACQTELKRYKDHLAQLKQQKAQLVEAKKQSDRAQKRQRRKESKSRGTQYPGVPAKTTKYFKLFDKYNKSVEKNKTLYNAYQKCARKHNQKVKSASRGSSKVTTKADLYHSGRQLTKEEYEALLNQSR